MLRNALADPMTVREYGFRAGSSGETSGIMSRHNRISGLAEIVAAAAGHGPAPVDMWNPPYCGDIGLRIGRDGTWYYRDSPIGRPAMVKLFARVLRRDDDGRHYLVTPAEKVDVFVEDAPFLAVEMQVDGEGREQVITFRTNVDDLIVCGPDHPIHFRTEDGSGGLKPYVRVRGRLEALLTRAVTAELVDLALGESAGDGGGNGVPAVRSGGMAFALPLTGDPWSS